MKKSLLAMLLAVAIVAPVFAAEKGSMEIDGKLGYVFSPSAKVELSSIGGGDLDVDFKSTFSLGADFFYYLEKEIALGFGLEHVFTSECDKFNGESSVPSDLVKVGTTNLFVQAKYDIALKNDIFNNIYPIVQLGYGIINLDGQYTKMINAKNGLYWGIGLGTTIKQNIIVELFYSVNNGDIELKGAPYKFDLTYKTFKLKVGYKFAI